MRARGSGVVRPVSSKALSARAWRLVPVYVALLCAASVSAAQEAGTSSGRPEPAGMLEWVGEPPLSQVDEGEVMTFARTVELALVSSPVRAAEAQLAVARASLEAALAPLSATASVEARTTSDFTGQGTNADLELGVNAVLRTGWGASGEAVAAAGRAVEAAEDAVAAARSDAVLRALRLYTEALAAEAARAVAELRVEIASVQADAVRARSAAGAALEGDVARAELEQVSADLELKAAEGEVAAAHATLSFELGVRVLGLDGGLPLGSLSEAESISGAIAARADVRAAVRELEAAEDALAQALRASGVNLAGNVSLSGGSGGTSFALAAGMDARDRTPSLSGRLVTSTGPAGAGAPAVRASVGVSATVPLSPQDGRVAAAEAAHARAEARLVEVAKRAHLEVAALAAQAEANEERLDIARSRAALAQAASEAAATRFELGVVNRVEVLQAHVAAMQAASAVHTAESAYLQGLMALARATGRSATEVLR